MILPMRAFGPLVIITTLSASRIGLMGIWLSGRVLPGWSVADAESVRRIAKLTLETYGYKVIEAPEADTAKDLFGKSGPIDIVVSDVIMPGINGRELAEHFRGLHRMEFLHSDLCRPELLVEIEGVAELGAIR